MVTCSKCHRRFSSNEGLLQHCRTRHPGITGLAALQQRVTDEKEASERAAAAMRSHGRSHLKVAVFLVLILVAVGVTAYVASIPREASAAGAPGVGVAAPDFTLPAIEGGSFRLSDYRGQKNVLLLFNEGLSCQPCLQQMHDLDSVNGQLTGMSVLMVSVTPDGVSQLQSWAGSSGPQYGRVLSDTGLVAFGLYKPAGSGGSMMTHTFVLVNKAGMIAWRQDYGPGSMYIQNSEIMAAVQRSLGA